MANATLSSRICIRCLSHAIGSQRAISFAEALVERGLVGRGVSFGNCYQCRWLCQSGRMDDHSFCLRVYVGHGGGLVA